MTYSNQNVNTKEEKVFVIRTQRLFEELANKVWCKRTGKGYNTLQITIDRHFENRLNGQKFLSTTIKAKVVAQPWNAMVDYLDVKDAFVLTQIGNKRKAEKVKRFTFSEIHVCCATEEAADIVMNTKRLLVFNLKFSK